MGRVVGIDLGTTNSCIAVLEGGKPMIVPNAEGERVTRSIVALTDDGEYLVGKPAANQAVLNPRNTIFSAKRLMGRRYAEVPDVIRSVPYVVKAGPEDAARIELAGELIAPEEIGAKIIRKLVEDASSYLDDAITDAVITCPAYFNDAQRQATMNAGQIAGLNVLRILNEPTSAALAYGIDARQNERVLVFDLGGGTLDVSLLDVVEPICEVCATSGDTHLGGDDFDKCIVDWLAMEFLDKYGIDLRNESQALQRLTEAAEKAKCELSSVTSAKIELPFITSINGEGIHLEKIISREKFEVLSAGLLQRCVEPVLTTLKDARCQASKIDEVLLVGGGSRMPSIRKLVNDITLGKEPNMAISPEEVVALGAAVQAGIISGEFDQMVLLDVTPFSLGIETKGGKFHRMIARNTAIPTRATQLFTTGDHFQRGVDVIVLQGESKRAHNNRTLGRFGLEGIRNKVAGEAEIEVDFDIDEDGILSVTARDLGTGNKRQITIAGTAYLDQQEVKDKASQAQKLAAEKQQKQLANVERQQAEYVLSTVENQLEFIGQAVPNELRSKCEKAMSALRTALGDGAPPKKLSKLKVSLELAAEPLQQIES